MAKALKYLLAFVFFCVPSVAGYFSCWAFVPALVLSIGAITALHIKFDLWRGM